MAWIVKFIMENFLYTFGGEDRRQSEGAPIGDEILQAIARHIGNEYDDKLESKLD